MIPGDEGVERALRSEKNARLQGSEATQALHCRA